MSLLFMVGNPPVDEKHLSGVECVVAVVARDADNNAIGCADDGLSAVGNAAGFYANLIGTVSVGHAHLAVRHGDDVGFSDGINAVTVERYLQNLRTVHPDGHITRRRRGEKQQQTKTRRYS